MRRLARALLWATATPLLVILLALAALWWWVGSDTSLATALVRAQGYLPPGYTLSAQGVSGSLRAGGHIDTLRYDAKGLVIEAHQVDLRWRPAALLDRRLELDSLTVQRLSIADQRPPDSTPMHELLLPLQVDLRFAVDELLWQGPPTVQASALAGRYQFDGQRHHLQLDRARYAAGQYQGQATLDAHAPMALDAQLQARLSTHIPGGAAAEWPLSATASAQGSLAGSDAKLAVRAQLQARAPGPANPTAKTQDKAQPATAPVQASLSATVQPWAAQPLTQADAQFQQFDLALLWPQAPATQLSGRVQVQPQGSNSAWLAQADVRNALAGPWDQHRLPLDSLQARALYRQGGWQVESLTGGIAGGQVQVTGQLSASDVTAPWTGQAQLHNVDPHALHSKLAQAWVDGTLAAHRLPGTAHAIAFEAQLSPSAQQGTGSPLKGLRLKNATVAGSYGAGLLKLQALKLQTDDATLQGQLDLQWGSRAAQGSLQLTLPGAEASAKGKLAAQDGSGEFALKVASAAQAQRWLAGLPGVPAAISTRNVQGNGVLAGQWQGGWHLEAQGRGSAMTLYATLAWPQLDIAAPGQDSAQAWHVRDVAAQLSGNLAALKLTANGQAQSGSAGRFKLQTRLSGGRNSGTGAWAGQLEAATLLAQAPQQPGEWTAQLHAPVAWHWAGGSNGGGSFNAEAGELRLSGPLPGSATLAWAPAQWRRDSANGPQQLQTKGQLKGLPLPWLNLLGSAQLNNLSLRGDLLLDGDWDVQLGGEHPQVKASLARRSGDLRLQVDEDLGAGQTLSAGLREARLSVSTQGDYTLRAQAAWASDNAGQVQAEFSSRFSSTDNGWAWPGDAPLSGSLRAQLPKVGVWSVVAPPGWRMRGTLDAAVTLKGTRQAPQWSGTLNADDLALRSVVQGIEFSNGRLRTSLSPQGGLRLNVDEFSLQGAGGSGNGGRLTANGYAQWAAGDSQNVLSRLRIALDAQATGLRLSSRSDRRLAVSGKAHAELANAQLQLRGELKADEALFILPSENTPSLGDDVVVAPRAKGAASAPATATASAAASAASAPATAGQPLGHEVQVALDLGEDFKVQGRGLVTRLAGALTLRDVAGMAPGGAGNTNGPRLTGEVRAVGGSYKAYGQQLDIEEGVLRFTGPYDNPALDILAIRPNLSQRVGVRITGTVLAPYPRLYAEPDLPDADKLAWLVLGRAAANGGSEAVVLQQAAIALLGGSGRGLTGGVAEALGLDELSFRGSSTNTDGSTSAAAVTLGKRFGKSFYVAYERSLAGTLGTFYIFYDLSKRFTLRAQTGEQSGADLIFTIPYD
jgi:translocation and assembly module TamB